MKFTTLAAALALFVSVPALAQDNAPRTKGEVKADAKAEQERIKAAGKIDRALNKEAQENVKADAEADRKKLKAHEKTQKEANKAIAKVNKADSKAEAEAAKAANGK